MESEKVSRVRDCNRGQVLMDLGCVEFSVTQGTPVSGEGSWEVKTHVSKIEPLHKGFADLLVEGQEASVYAGLSPAISVSDM
jgi:hypothetical protein